MNCPVCGIGMIEVEIAGVKIDYCQQGCKGVWFDNFELRKLDEKHEGSGEILEEILSAPRRDDSCRTSPLECPRCEGVKMKRHRYSYKCDVFVDQCYSCNGIWLDGGELKAVRDNFASECERMKAVDSIIASNPEIAAYLEKMKKQREEVDEIARNRFNATKSFFRFASFGLFR